MKRLSYFLCSALVVLGGAASCEKEAGVVDYPIEGPLTFSGTYDTYLHGTQGWIEEDKLGIYVISDGVAQSNLQYEPVEVSVPEIIEMDDKKYIMYNGDEVLTTTFKPVGEEAGFKKGSHYVYAYTPYAAGNDDYKAVKLPYNAVQEYNSTQFRADWKYTFAHAKLTWPLNALKTEAISFGDFISPYVAMTIPTPEFGETFKEGQKISKVVISSDLDIAVEDATINLETAAISGALGKSIEIAFPEGPLELNSNPYVEGLSMETLYVSVLGDFAEAVKAEYTVTYTIDGKEYTTKGKPATSFVIEGNVNLSGLVLE